ncbi:bifunctional isochorismate lyase/aryl carrier protein [Kitasatospora sp. MAA4]|uniref:isochorismatase family protein n=1 Tax=Kitasatospora sp. MAA4 TaxID=3035093 RepID=UPI002475833A|nr:isochorismatase family protein [Kitasatospora sp. MAA4]MDH6130785.1 bifunctional isochorismate lyase/aryl carrier protein [Kitasatospora sp. MAA4]
MALPAIAPYPMPTADNLPANKVDWQVDPSRAVLLVHDLQNYFLDAFTAGASPLTELLANIRWVKDSCERLGIPVVYSAQPGGQNPAERGLQLDFWGAGLPDDERARSVVPELAPTDHDTVLTKWKYSAFVRTDLAERMAAQGRDQLIIVGVYAHIGVLMSACDAWMRDIAPFLVADAVADFSAEDHATALRWAAQKCAVVTTTDRLTEELAA